MTAQTWGIILMVYGVFCLYIAFLKPPFIMNIKKLKIMEKMMGKRGIFILLLVWGGVATFLGYWLYSK